MKTVGNLRIAVLASGSGRTLQNFIDLSKNNKLKADVAVVGVTNHKIYAKQRAEAASIPVFVSVKRRVDPTVDFSEKVFNEIRKYDVDYVCLAGFKYLLKIPDDFTNRVINIHPSLIPNFCGKGFYGDYVHKAVFEAGSEVSGCTVHYCDDIYDHGDIILQKSANIEDCKSYREVAARVFQLELEAYPEVINMLAAKK